MAVSSAGSVTERLEQLGRQASEQDYTRHASELQQQPASFSRAARMVENSIRQQPVKWALISLGAGCLIGATWFLSTRDWR